MAHITQITEAELSASTRGALRQSQAHAAFASEKVQLAFGRHKDGRIRHVSNVARGLDCDSQCPACAEQLVARHGKQKAWHFAHASGKSCREALSAAFATYLAQMLRDGASMSLPDIEWKWGVSVNRHPVPALTAHKVEVVQPGPAAPYELRIDARVGDQMMRLRILFRATRTPAFPPTAQLEQEGVSALEIDLVAPLAALLGNGDLAALSEDWAREQLLHAAPRAWLWSMAAAERRSALADARLSRHMEAFERLSTSQAPHPSEDLVERLGLARLLEGPNIRGEHFLGPSVKGWRAAILTEVIFAPVMAGVAEMAISEVGFGRREITRVMGREKLVRSPQLMQPLESDDLIELRYRVHHLRKPIEIVDDYLEQLWGQDIIRAKPSRENLRGRGKLDERLRGPDMPSWIITDAMISHLRRFFPLSSASRYSA